MSAFQSLAEEHRLLWGLVSRLEASLQEKEARTARRAARGVLFVLMNALEGHQELEDRIFVRVGGEPGAEDEDSLVLVRRQHEEIDRLRREASELLREATGVELERLRPLARSLAAALRGHFETEERELWPRWSSIESRCVRRGVDRCARERVEALKSEIEGLWAEVDEYLSGGA